MSEQRLERMLEQWEEAAARGKEIGPDELCPDDQELAGRLAYQIGVLRQMRRLAVGLGDPAPPGRTR